jgi:hypothetical protein
MARPTKMTSERGTQFCDLVACGWSRARAARACGITATTVYRWMKRGEAEPEGPFGEFCTALKRADAAAEAGWLQPVTAAAERGDWKAAAWLLERRHPQKWGRGRRQAAKPSECRLERVFIAR